MKHKVGDQVSFQIPMVYKMNSVEYQTVEGEIVEVYPNLKGYDILPNGYDTSFYVTEERVFGKIK